MSRPSTTPSNKISLAEMIPTHQDRLSSILGITNETTAEGLIELFREFSNNGDNLLSNSTQNQLEQLTIRDVFDLLLKLSEFKTITSDIISAQQAELLAINRTDQENDYRLEAALLKQSQVFTNLENLITNFLNLAKDRYNNIVFENRLAEIKALSFKSRVNFLSLKKGNSEEPEILHNAVANSILQTFVDAKESHFSPRIDPILTSMRGDYFGRADLLYIILTAIEADLSQTQTNVLFNVILNPAGSESNINQPFNIKVADTKLFCDIISNIKLSQESQDYRNYYNQDPTFDLFNRWLIPLIESNFSFSASTKSFVDYKNTIDVLREESYKKQDYLIETLLKIDQTNNDLSSKFLKKISLSNFLEFREKIPEDDERKTSLDYYLYQKLADVTDSLTIITNSNPSVQTKLTEPRNLLQELNTNQIILLIFLKVAAKEKLNSSQVEYLANHSRINEVSHNDLKAILNYVGKVRFGGDNDYTNDNATASDDILNCVKFIYYSDKNLPLLDINNTTPDRITGSTEITNINNREFHNLHDNLRHFLEGAINRLSQRLAAERLAAERLDAERLAAERADKQKRNDRNNMLAKGGVIIALSVAAAYLSNITAKETTNTNETEPTQNPKSFEAFKEKISKLDSANKTIILNYDELSDFKASDYSNATRIIFFRNNLNPNLVSLLALNRPSLEDPFETHFISEVDGAPGFDIGGGFNGDLWTLNNSSTSTYKFQKSNLNVADQNQLDHIRENGFKIDENQIIESKVTSSEDLTKIVSMVKDHLRNLDAAAEELYQETLDNVLPPLDFALNTTQTEPLSKKNNQSIASLTHNNTATNSSSILSFLKVAGAAFAAVNGSTLGRNISNGVAPYSLSNGQSSSQFGSYSFKPSFNYLTSISQPFGNSYLSILDPHNLLPTPNYQLRDGFNETYFSDHLRLPPPNPDFSKPKIDSIVEEVEGLIQNGKKLDITCKHNPSLGSEEQYTASNEVFLLTIEVEGEEIKSLHHLNARETEVLNEKLKELKLRELAKQSAGTLPIPSFEFDFADLLKTPTKNSSISSSQLTPFFTDPLIAELATETQQLERVKSIQDLGNKVLKKAREISGSQTEILHNKIAALGDLSEPALFAKAFKQIPAGLQSYDLVEIVKAGREAVSRNENFAKEKAVLEERNLESGIERESDKIDQQVTRINQTEEKESLLSTQIAEIKSLRDDLVSLEDEVSQKQLAKAIFDLEARFLADYAIATVTYKNGVEDAQTQINDLKTKITQVTKPEVTTLNNIISDQSFAELNKKEIESIIDEESKALKQDEELSKVEVQKPQYLANLTEEQSSFLTSEMTKNIAKLENDLKELQSTFEQQELQKELYIKTARTLTTRTLLRLTPVANTLRSLLRDSTAIERRFKATADEIASLESAKTIENQVKEKLQEKFSLLSEAKIDELVAGTAGIKSNPKYQEKEEELKKSLPPEVAICNTARNLINSFSKEQNLLFAANQKVISLSEKLETLKTLEPKLFALKLQKMEVELRVEEVEELVNKAASSQRKIAENLEDKIANLRDRDSLQVKESVAQKIQDNFSAKLNSLTADEINQIITDEFVREELLKLDESGTEYNQNIAQLHKKYDEDLKEVDDQKLQTDLLNEDEKQEIESLKKEYKTKLERQFEADKADLDIKFLTKSGFERINANLEAVVTYVNSAKQTLDESIASISNSKIEIPSEEETNAIVLERLQKKFPKVDSDILETMIRENIKEFKDGSGNLERDLEKERGEIQNETPKYPEYLNSEQSQLLTSQRKKSLGLTDLEDRYKKLRIQRLENGFELDKHNLKVTEIDSNLSAKLKEMEIVSYLTQKEKDEEIRNGSLVGVNFTGNTSNQDLEGFSPSSIISSTADLLASIITNGHAITERQKDIFGNFIYTLENSDLEGSNIKYQLTPSEDLLLREKLTNSEIPKKLETPRTDHNELSIEEIHLEEIPTTTNTSSTNSTAQLVTPIVKEQVLVNQTSDVVISAINTAPNNPPQIKNGEPAQEKGEKENSYTDFFRFATGALSTTTILAGFAAISSTSSEPVATTPKTNSTKAESIEEVIAKINKNSKYDSSIVGKTNQAKHWYNNKKLLKVLKKIAGTNFENDFEGLKTALNSKDNQNNANIKLLELNIGDLSVLDAIDNLDLKRAGSSIKEINHSRENLKTMIGLIPKDKNTREEFFRIPRDKNFVLEIITPSNNPTNAEATKFLQKVEPTRHN